MVDIGTLEAQLTADIGRMRKAMNRAEGMVKDYARTVDKSLDRSERRWTKFGGALSTRMSSIRSTIFSIQGALAGLGGAFVIGDTIRKGAQFEQTMTRVGAVANATAMELKSLNDIAREMGETTEWSASQAAEGLQFLSMAGFRAADSIEALPGVLDLATASSVDLGRAADIASNALTSMRLPTEELSRVNDTFVKTMTSSNVNMEMMAESFKYAGSVGAAFGYEIEQIAALIGQLGNAGIQGGMAGTQLAMAFQQANEVFKEYEQRGIDTTRYTKDLVGALKLLEDQGADAAEVMDIFGQRAGRGVTALLGVGTDAVERFTDSLYDAEGITSRIGREFRRTTIGAFKELRSVIESVQIDLFTAQSGELNQTIRDTTKYIRENKDEFIDFANTSIEAAKGLGKTVRLIGDVFGAVIQGWNSLPSEIQGAGLIGTLFFGKKILGVTALTGVVNQQLNSLWKPINDFSNATAASVASLRKQAFQLEEQTSEASRLIDSYKELTKRSQLTEAGQQELKSTIEDLSEIFPKLADEIQGATASINELNQAQKRLKIENTLEQLEKQKEATIQRLGRMEAQNELARAEFDKQRESSRLVPSIYPSILGPPPEELPPSQLPFEEETILQTKQLIDAIRDKIKEAKDELQGFNQTAAKSGDIANIFNNIASSAGNIATGLEKVNLSSATIGDDISGQKQVAIDNLKQYFDEIKQVSRVQNQELTLLQASESERRIVQERQETEDRIRELDNRLAEVKQYVLNERVLAKKELKNFENASKERQDILIEGFKNEQDVRADWLELIQRYNEARVREQEIGNERIKQLQEKEDRRQRERLKRNQEYFRSQFDPGFVYSQIMRDLKEVRDEGLISLQTYSAAAKAAQDELMRRQNDMLMLTEDFAAGAKVAFSEYADSAENAAENAHRAFTNAFQSLEDQLTQFISTGKTDWMDLVNTIKEDMIRLAIRQNITGPLSAGIAGGVNYQPNYKQKDTSNFLSDIGSFFGSLFTRADGGQVYSGNDYLVGERGPEIFRPEKNGEIISNKELNTKNLQPANKENLGLRIDKIEIHQNGQGRAQVRAVNDRRSTKQTLVELGEAIAQANRSYQ